jgi:hypothetical protein
MLTTITASAVDHDILVDHGARRTTHAERPSDIIVILKPRSHGLRQLPCFPPP